MNALYKNMSSGASRGTAILAFTMIEVVLALGVLASAFLLLFGLMQSGQGMLTSAIDGTVAMQIVQRVTTLANQANFSELSKLNINPGTDSKGEKADYFFDEQGNELATAADSKCVYTAAVVILTKSGLPGRTTPDGSQSTSTVQQLESPHFATLNIIIRKNNRAETMRTVNTLVANNGL